MNTIKTFPKGGVHPEDKKGLACEKPLKNAVIPSHFIVPMAQSLGSPAECLVHVGDEVREGMLIGKATGFISSNVHSPVPGLVKEIRTIYLPNGVKTQAAVIEMQGEFDRSGKKQDARGWEQFSTEELLGIMAEKGLVGLGGATFPVHVKLSIPKGATLDTLVVNGVECEPYLTADHRLMLEKTAEIIEGIRIVFKVVKPKVAYIGIEINKPDTIEVMEKAAHDSGLPLSVIPLKVKYPQGDEKQLLKAVTGKEVPSGELPLAIGAVVVNVGTIYSIYEAVVFDKPLIERVVTVSGGCIKEPANLKVRIGTPMSSLIDECGGFLSVPEKIVAGGPLMGFGVYDLESPVTKGTSGVLALSAKEVRGAQRTACISCGRCIHACPMGLSPTALFKQIDHGEYKLALSGGLLDCKECGCCAYVCPSHIPLVQGMRLGKRMARRKKVNA